mmetsp:Transcript_32289/g.47739  ORF Transcript_32289/g.47739 Transcript_32289/m.47739 type:complete len:253 (+) Transcript_32289:587-1345(+)
MRRHGGWVRRSRFGRNGWRCLLLGSRSGRCDGRPVARKDGCRVNRWIGRFRCVGSRDHGCGRDRRLGDRCRRDGGRRNGRCQFGENDTPETTTATFRAVTEEIVGIVSTQRSIDRVVVVEPFLFGKVMQKTIPRVIQFTALTGCRTIPKIIVHTLPGQTTIRIDSKAENISRRRRHHGLVDIGIEREVIGEQSFRTESYRIRLVPTSNTIVWRGQIRLNDVVIKPCLDNNRTRIHLIVRIRTVERFLVGIVE